MQLKVLTVLFGSAKSWSASCRFDPAWEPFTHRAINLDAQSSPEAGCKILIEAHSSGAILLSRGHTIWSEVAGEKAQVVIVNDNKFKSLEMLHVTRKNFFNSQSNSTREQLE